MSAADRYPSPWDDREVPLDVVMLGIRARTAAAEVDRVAPLITELLTRIDLGRQKLITAEAEGRKEAAAAISLKIAELEDELASQRRLGDIAAILTEAHEIALTWSARRLPEGSVMSVDVPGRLRFTVALDDSEQEPPF